MTPVSTPSGLLLFAAQRRAALEPAAPGPTTDLTRRARTVALATVALVGVLLGALSASPVSAMESDGFADGHGVFEFDDGEVITLFGAHPMVEFAGEEIHLRFLDEDHYEADSPPFEQLRLERSADGQVDAIAYLAPGGPARIAQRVDAYREVEVSIGSDGELLAGSLLLPTGPGPHPAVAVVHGAEFATRETYRITASHLARRGVAALIYDKRGTGESTGIGREATFDDLTSDALAAVALLREQAEIDASRVGLVGMSQGGWIIANAAIRSDDVAFLVAMSASGFTPAEQAAWLTGSMLTVRGLGQPALEMSGKAWAMLYSSLDLVEAGVIEPMPETPGFWFHALDPHLSARELWTQVRQPVLGMWGELDCQVPAYDSLAVIRESLDRGPNESHRLVIYPGADHGLMTAGACEREIGMTHGARYAYASGVLSAPAEWIHEVGRTSASGTGVMVPAEPTPSSLGWHQTTDTSAPWFGSFATQLVVMGLLALGHTVAVVVAVARTVVSRGRQTRLAGATVMLTAATGIGLIATVLGALVLVELLALADLHSMPLLGDEPIGGATLLTVAAWVTTLITVGLGIGVALRLARTDGGWQRPPLGAVTVAGLALLLAGWSAYWGILPLGALG